MGSVATSVLRGLLPVLGAASLAACSAMPDDGGASGAPPGPAGSAWEQAIVDLHNGYRAAVGVSPLGWSADAATHAKAWADHLAETGLFEHSQAPDRVDEGENLWKGTAGAYGAADMVGAWGDERSVFRYGAFPDCSTTGDWHDVGHYTQLIWRGTTNVGCALSTAKGADVLVCRYAPPGNYVGQTPY